MIAVAVSYQQFKIVEIALAGGPAMAAAAVVEYARNIGFFGLWFEQFKHEPIVIQGLIYCIPGTAKNCFNPADSYKPIPRNPDNAIDPI
jgi:hypothetical protein